MSHVTVIRNSRLYTRLSTQRRHYNVSAIRNSVTLADVVIQPQPILKTSEGIFRAREHGNKALPVSNLLNFVEEERKAKSQPEPEAEIVSDFQKELANNPFAQALATSVRQCNLTQARLPTHFLLPTTTIIFRTTTHPERPPRVTANLRLGPRSQFPGEETLNSQSYVLGRQDLVNQLGKKSRWQFLPSERQRKLMGKLTGRNWQGGKFVKECWTWEEGEDERVREMLEREVVEGVREIFEGKSGHGQTAAGIAGIPVVLRVGSPEGMDCGGDGLVYDLRSVLSPGSLRSVAKEFPSTSGMGVCLSPDAYTTKLLLAFARLQRYLNSSDKY